jgi:hypothetical protein
MKRYLAVTAAAIAIALVPSAAFADSCSNVSRAAPACGMTCTSPVVAGNWVWLPSIGVPFPAWGDSPPGSITSIQLGLPNANGQYLGQQGTVVWLLENSAICNGKVVSRQTAHGIQSGCGA